jgi:hypothetical protein
VPGGTPADPLANGGAFGGKEASPVAAAARQLADRYGRAVRTLFSREDVVRYGPTRPPFAGSAVLAGRTVAASTTWVGELAPEEPVITPYQDLVLAVSGELSVPPGPPASGRVRASGSAELVVLLEGALTEAAFEREPADERGASVKLDDLVRLPGSDALAGARVDIDHARGAVDRVEVRVAAGDPLDESVLRSYAIAAAHMALGWVFTEGLAVDAETGEVLDLTIRSFGIVPARSTPPIDVTIVDESGPPLPRSSDAVFAAVAASAWDAVTRADGERPEAFPALHTRAARRLRA